MLYSLLRGGLAGGPGARAALGLRRRHGRAPARVPHLQGILYDIIVYYSLV